MKYCKNNKTRKSNGSGSLYFSNAKNCYVYQITFKDYELKKHRKSFYGQDPDELKNKAKEFLLKNSNTLDFITKDFTIPDILLKEYERELRMNKVSESTYYRKLDTLKIIQNHIIGTIPINLLTDEQIESFLYSIKRYSESCISKVYAALRKAFKLALEDKIINELPFDKRYFEKPESSKPTKIVRAFTIEEQNEFVNYLMNRNVNKNRNNYDLQFLIELYTGLRMGEINALKSSDIDFNMGVINISKTISRTKNNKPIVKNSPKTKKGFRTVPMSKQAEVVLKEAIKVAKKNKDGLLFYDYTQNQPILTQITNESFRRICKTLNFDISGQHLLRHTFATRCIESGVQPVVLKEWLGHTDVSITLNTYTTVFQRMNNQSIRLLDLYSRENVTQVTMERLQYNQKNVITA